MNHFMLQVDRQASVALRQERRTPAETMASTAATPACETHCEWLARQLRAHDGSLSATSNGLDVAQPLSRANANTQLVIESSEHAAGEGRAALCLASAVDDVFAPSVHANEGEPDELALSCMLEELLKRDDGVVGDFVWDEPIASGFSWHVAK